MIFYHAAGQIVFYTLKFRISQFLTLLNSRTDIQMCPENAAKAVSIIKK